MRRQEDDLRILRLLRRGKRGVVYRGVYRGKSCAVKMQRPGSEAMGRISNEGLWLARVNAKGIGPQLYVADEKKVVMELIAGDSLDVFLKECKDVKLKKKVLLDLLRQCYELDKLKVNKQEMHRATKNVIVRKKDKKPVLIDFERCKVVVDLKNVSQFCTFLLKTKVFAVDTKKLTLLIQAYKKTPTERSFKKILQFFSSPVSVPSSF